MKNPNATVKLDFTAQELDDIGNGLGLLAASLKRASNAETDLEVKALRDRSHARVVSTIARLTNLPLEI